MKYDNATESIFVLRTMGLIDDYVAPKKIDEYVNVAAHYQLFEGQDAMNVVVKEYVPLNRMQDYLADLAEEMRKYLPQQYVMTDDGRIFDR